MDIAAVAKMIYSWTSGYPFMVSAICWMTDEEGRSWDIPALEDTVRDFIGSENMLFDDLAKNLQQNPDFAKLTQKIILDGEKISYFNYDPLIELGRTFGVFKISKTDVAIANAVFETFITNYFVSINETRSLIKTKYASDRSHFIENGELNMRHILETFNTFLCTEYRKSDADFIERQGRLLFLCFIKGIINGEGNYAVEPETRDGMRMDIVIYWHGSEYIVELKIWRGESYEEAGMRQLAEYLKSRGQSRGWLLSYANLAKAPREGGLVSIDGVEIYEEIVAYRDKAR
jgi:hypothetical protein